MSCSSCSSNNNNPNNCTSDCSSCSDTSCASRETQQQSSCSHDCSSCSEHCAPPKVGQNQYSNIRHLIGVVSGKGGVGKSMVTCSMAAAMAKLGLQDRRAGRRHHWPLRAQDLRHHPEGSRL